jgi:hypothetical protein
MDITSPYVVVTAIVVAFLASILFATSSRPNDAHHEDHGRAH